MKSIAILMVWGSLTAQNLLAEEPYNSSDERSQYPKLTNDLNLDKLLNNILIYDTGKIEVEFDVNKAGVVENPIIVDTFNIKFNDAVLDAVNKLTFCPAMQNGRPVKVKYYLPIVVR